VIGPKRRRPTGAERRAVHAAVSLRSRGICEGCGRRPKSDRHHRQHGANGRFDSISNLLDLCGGPAGMPGGNHSGCHGVAHSREGRLLGWSVNGGNDPAAIPVYRKHDDVWSLDGRAIPHAAAVQILFDAGVIDDVAAYVEWFDEMRRTAALEVPA
jgi:hypothetical protein